jgi:hypothetical protein
VIINMKFELKIETVAFWGMMLEVLEILTNILGTISCL